MQLGLLQVVPLKTKSMYPGGPQAYLWNYEEVLEISMDLVWVIW